MNMRTNLKQKSHRNQLMKNDLTGLYEQIQEAVDCVRKRGYKGSPDAALIFGSGLGEIALGMDVDLEVPYSEIPGFVTTTLDFHKGRLLFGRAGSRSVVAMDGRFHYYEGYSMREITFPVRVMNALGAKILLLSNIAGGLNPEFRASDVVIISDHINFMGANPLIGANDERLGCRYPDMMEPYSHRLIEIAEKHARRLDIKLQRAVYFALSGPTFETRAEYRMIRGFGADLVGMSSVPEVIAAKHGGMEVMGLSLISDECFPDCLEPLAIEVLLERASKGSKIIAEIFNAVLGDENFLESANTKTDG